jgi:hypothetical protein
MRMIGGDDADLHQTLILPPIPPPGEFAETGAKCPDTRLDSGEIHQIDILDT